MTFPDLVRAFSEISGHSLRESKEICECMKEVVMTAMLEHEPIKINGFGTLEVFAHKPHRVKNFEGNWVQSNPKNLIRFRVGEKFLDELNP